MPEGLPDIIDNSEGKKLSAVLNKLLEQGEPSVRIVTAYFNHSGFAVLKNGLENAKEIKLLLGKVRSGNENLSSVIDCGTRRK